MDNITGTILDKETQEAHEITIKFYDNCIEITTDCNNRVITYRIVGNETEVSTKTTQTGIYYKS